MTLESHQLAGVIIVCAVAGLILQMGCIGRSGALETTNYHTADLRKVHSADPDSIPGAPLQKCGIVLDTGQAGQWDDGMVESPVVWFDERRDQYGMVYTGYGRREDGGSGYESVTRPQVGLAWSTDLFHWEKATVEPLFGAAGEPGSPDESGATGPFVRYEDGVYYLFYIGVTDSGYEKGRKTLNLATSSDLQHWSRYSGNPIIEPAGDGWRRDAIWHPNVVKVGPTYFLFFNASGVVDGAHEERIGYATSSDLFEWEVDDEHSPVLAGSGEPGAWDASGRAGDPSLYQVNGTWYMAYYSWDGTHSQDGLAWTTGDEFPLGWRPFMGNPVLQIGARGTFDAAHAAKPFIFRTSERHFHFYTAVDEHEARAIALAVSPGPCADER